ncbi:MAG: hypothetical protein CMN76_01530 [Spirochaetaceae bacterium]|nr:hypothetical protein [Spirochaetaceae bacterium]|tara:strand:+ start:14065 stop:14367 length:303 start_codon:yes stop_codon:yes gene_type:complete
MVADTMAIGAEQYLEASNGRVDISQDVYMLAFAYNNGVYSKTIDNSNERMQRSLKDGRTPAFRMVLRDSQPALTWRYLENAMSSQYSSTEGNYEVQVIHD